MRRLVDTLAETVNLTVLTGSEVRFIGSVECDRVLRVGDRTGRTLPAHLSSGGKAVLATLSPDDLAAALGHLDEATAARLVRELRTVRRRGIAVNDQETETGLTAVGVVVPDRSGAPSAALCLATPSARYSRDLLPSWRAALSEAAEKIAVDLAAS
jgi:DNA-binding IclR family transcriptional regulator